MLGDYRNQKGMHDLNAKEPPRVLLGFSFLFISILC
jgi:hypothetical protein